MTTLLQDLRYSARMLGRSPGFTAVAILTLALGIGANTAIFSVVHGVLLRDLPYRDAPRLVVVWEDLIREGNHRFSVAAPNFEDLSVRSRSFQGLAAQLGAMYSLASAGETPEAVYGARVSGNFFSVLGARPALGRGILPADAERGKAKHVAVLGYALWKRRFGADAGILGRFVRFSDVPHEIVGVMRPDFDPPSQLKAPNQAAEIWTPMDLPPAWNARGIAALQVIGRLRPGISVEKANAEIEGIARALAREYPVTNANIGMHVVPLSRQLLGDVRPALLVLSGAVGFVFIAVCANIAHLLLARAVARRREIAIRVALGASRRRIAAAFLAEGLLLAAAGGTLGWLLVLATRSALIAAAPPNVPRLSQVRPDLAVLAFAFLATLAAGLACALLPAFRAAASDPDSALRDEPTGSGRSAGRLRAILVVSQIALALMLFAGAALLVRTFERLRSFDIGFSAENVITARMGLPRLRYDTPERQLAFFQELFRRLGAEPGIVAAGGTTRFPLDPAYGVGEISFEGRPAPSGNAPVVGVRAIEGDYFGALRIPIRSGRGFQLRDRADSPPIALVNATMATRFWPGQSPVGQRIGVGIPVEAWRTVVGVVGDVSHDGIDAAPTPEVYLPLAQSVGNTLNLVVRSADGRRDLTAVLRREVAALDPDLPLTELRPMRDRISDALAQPRFLLEAFAGFAALTLALSALALFALMAHDVQRRRREVGIRMAVGARSVDILRLFLWRATRLVAAGVAVGLAGALALTRLLAPALHGTRPDDPKALAGSAAVLTLVALLAVLIPARRAAHNDPTETLRSE
jgi:putative ABC transport system permease protein